jgi:hypothetical protein
MENSQIATKSVLMPFGPFQRLVVSLILTAATPTNTFDRSNGIVAESGVVA